MGRKPRNADGSLVNPACPRRAVGFWAPFNEWWRALYKAQDRRPRACEVSTWYDNFADDTWPGDKPNWVDCREHAKCLRSPEEVRTYFKAYRAQKREQADAAAEETRGTKRPRLVPTDSQAAESETSEHIWEEREQDQDSTSLHDLIQPRGKQQQQQQQHNLHHYLQQQEQQQQQFQQLQQKQRQEWQPHLHVREPQRHRHPVILDLPFPAALLDAAPYGTSLHASQWEDHSHPNHPHLMHGGATSQHHSSHFQSTLQLSRQVDKQSSDTCIGLPPLSGQHQGNFSFPARGPLLRNGSLLHNQSGSNNANLEDSQLSLLVEHDALLKILDLQVPPHGNTASLNLGNPHKSQIQGNIPSYTPHSNHLHIPVSTKEQQVNSRRYQRDDELHEYQQAGFNNTAWQQQQQQQQLDNQRHPLYTQEQPQQQQRLDPVQQFRSFHMRDPNLATDLRGTDPCNQPAASSANSTATYTAQQNMSHAQHNDSNHHPVDSRGSFVQQTQQQMQHPQQQTQHDQPRQAGSPSSAQPSQQRSQHSFYPPPTQPLDQAGSDNNSFGKFNATQSLHLSHRDLQPSEITFPQSMTALPGSDVPIKTELQQATPVQQSESASACIGLSLHGDRPRPLPPSSLSLGNSESLHLSPFLSPGGYPNASCLPSPSLVSAGLSLGLSASMTAIWADFANAFLAQNGPPQP